MLSKLIHRAFFDGGATAVRELVAEPRYDIMRKGEQSAYVTMILDGWAASYTPIGTGRRQLHTIFLPGDLCNSGISHFLDYSVVALSQIRIAQLPRVSFENLMEEHPALGRAVWRQEFIQSAMLRQLTTAIGVKSAYERLAHVFAEIFLRMQARGYVENETCPFWLTQIDLAELVGMTSVHVNRMVQRLKREGLIAQGRRTLRIPDMPKLLQVARLDPSYLGAGSLSAVQEDTPPQPMIVSGVQALQ